MILVTGATGLVGSQLLLSLAKGNAQVRALKRPGASMDVVRLAFRNELPLFEKVEWMEGDVNDLFSIEDAFRDVKEVYHCAAKVSFIPAEFRQVLKTNTEGTANMVNMALAASVEKFCHVSSTAALGRSAPGEELTEETTWTTSRYNSGYAISKYGAEREVWRAMEEGLNAVIVNPSIVIGPGDLRTGSSMLFGAVKDGLRFFPTGSSGFVDVRDVVTSMTRLMHEEAWGQRFIVSSQNVSYREIIDEIATCFGKKRPTITVGKTLAEIGWRAEWLRTLITRSQPMITKETARNGTNHWNYSNAKIASRINMKFIPVSESIKWTCSFF